MATPDLDRLFKLLQSAQEYKYVSNVPRPRVHWPEADARKTGEIACRLSHNMDDPEVFTYVMMYNFASYFEDVYEKRGDWGDIGDEQANQVIKDAAGWASEECRLFWLFLGLFLMGKDVNERTYYGWPKKRYMAMTAGAQRKISVHWPQGTHEGATKFQCFLKGNKDLVKILMRYVLEVNTGPLACVIKQARLVLQWSGLHTVKAIERYLQSPPINFFLPSLHSPQFAFPPEKLKEALDYRGALQMELNWESKTFNEKFNAYKEKYAERPHLLPYGRVLGLPEVEWLNQRHFPHLAAVAQLTSQRTTALMTTFVPAITKILGDVILWIKILLVLMSNNPTKHPIGPENPPTRPAKKRRIDSGNSPAK